MRARMKGHSKIVNAAPPRDVHIIVVYYSGLKVKADEIDYNKSEGRLSPSFDIKGR